MIGLRAALRHASTRGNLRALATTNDPANPTDSIPRRFETFYDDALDAVDELRTTGVAADSLPDTAATTEFVIVDPDTDVEVDDVEAILMEDVRSTSSSTSTSGSSSSGSDEGSDEDDTHADADGELVPSPPRAGIPALETAAADSSVAYKPGKPAAADAQPPAHSHRRSFHSTVDTRTVEGAATRSPTASDSGSAARGQASTPSRPSHDPPEPNYDPSEAIAEEVLGVGAPHDSLQYKGEIEELDNDPFGPDPDLLTDDADPPPEALKRAHEIGGEVEKVFGRI